MAAGGWLIAGGLAALREAARGRAGTDLPWFALFSVGFALAGGGLIVGAASARDLRRRRRAARVRDAHPDEPWMWEHPWHPSGAWDDEGGRRAVPFIAPLAVTAFLLPFNWAVLRGVPIGAPGWVVGAAVLLGDLLCAAAWTHALRHAARRRRHGRTAIRWPRVPLTPGGRAELTATLPASLDAGSRVTAELRCVREAIVVVVTQGRRRRRQTRHVVHHVLWRQARELEAGGDAATLTYDLPSEAPATALLAPEPTYWELALVAAGPGQGFAATYLVPVYAPARASR